MNKSSVHNRYVSFNLLMVIVFLPREISNEIVLSVLAKSSLTLYVKGYLCEFSV